MISEDEINQIWRLVSLDRYELERGSGLRRAVADLERFDVENGAELVDRVRYLLLLLDDKEELISEAQDMSLYSSVNVSGVVAASFKGNADAVFLEASRKQSIIEELKALLRLDEYVAIGTRKARVRGIGDRRWGHGYRVGYGGYGGNYDD